MQSSEPPARVVFETERGTVVTGTVVEPYESAHVDVDKRHRGYVVDVPDVTPRFRVPVEEATRVTDS